ncbi:MAG: bifunctional 5,10-methylenetetrahydrofolate dehydrogenase/5,10-methenyltetrahydrofolate cyclohydrolase [Candidatus Omnitrophica bacterium]|nr:bifunctional 5,10-methylenetetrahydrofolate dehydrogenase/5,10-methenyltetrahydrofolate cyclohydrolase [Candidatus Omnitrophota bacterium]MBU1127542.1 bifunctional 5,10-methylenetetrahydrofolate dehydrogenase/5,10-methenyltetrahydrofolate cyclohydrolase [Candidatus Omnitrophota bacterium]MBU1784081.1 bifunctional 5,10-methylenetetrahydrofolate dehydrogenase/5,10-methenyltetrahydrofolate cyclohydrolase [Candidatus Omnitrophota bacterium]MBU1851389.1 bifunctional 5,10-methylenetetrahydrofolate 
MAELIDGRKIAREMRVDIKQKLDALRGSGEFPPKLVSVTIGKVEDARLYAKVQESAAEEIGVEFDVYELDEDVGQGTLLGIIEKLNTDKTVTAIIIQQPFPAALEWDKIVFAIAPEKDAEGIHPWNLGRIFRRDADIVPCTPGAVMKILRAERIDLYGRDVVIVGHSAIVGKPLSLMMLNEFATTSVCHIGTAEKGDITAYTKRADVLVVAVGSAGMVKGDWVRKGAVVIDVGINNVPGGIVGDVDFDDVFPKVKKITPVPGGVGPITVSILMRNVLRAYRMQHEKV